MKIGVISDTHNFFDPKIPSCFEGVEHIFHGGDIGSSRIIQELEQIAPVTAVLGNTDDSGVHFRETEVCEVGGRRFMVHHIVDPRRLTDLLMSRIAREKPDVLIFGHTHKPFNETINKTLFFNPGYAGKSRFGMERTLAILHCDRTGIRPEYRKL